MTLFWWSTPLRLVAAIIFSVTVREVRPVGQARLAELVRDFLPLPAKGAANERYRSAQTIAERASHAHSSSAFDAFELE